MNTKEFIKRAREIHGNKYDYSKTIYNGYHVKLCIICPEHGEFWQTPSNHCSKYNHCGCPSCNKFKKLTTEEFILKARKIHSDKYDYSKVEYINTSTPVCIICPKHGEFYQTPDSHLQGCGCLLCNNINKSVDNLANVLKENNIIFEREKTFEWLGRQRLDFYLPEHNIAIEYQGEQHLNQLNILVEKKDLMIDKKEIYEN